MHPIVIIGPLISVLMIVVGITCNLVYRNRIMNMARKIDPTVKNLTEANRVLELEKARAIGKDATDKNVKVEMVDEKQMFCKHCGQSIDADSTFCNHCGKEQ